MPAPIVDAHQHFWDPERAAYPWMTDVMAAIRRPMGPEDLEPALRLAKVDATVLVQTRASVDETCEFLAIAANTPFVAGVVGWVDLTDRAVGDAIAALREERGGERLAGIRHQVHDEPDPEWLLRPAVRRGLVAVGEAGLAYDLLVRTRELPAALTVAREMPETRFVIDHLAKPPIRDGAMEPWATRLAEFGPLENVWCKVSGLVTEADWQRWKPEQVAPFVDRALSIVGSRRLIFGSDWPVCLLASSYQRVFELAATCLPGLSEDERTAVFGKNAVEAYQLDLG
jgi:L-fuconolactonase